MNEIATKEDVIENRRAIRGVRNLVWTLVITLIMVGGGILAAVISGISSITALIVEKL